MKSLEQLKYINKNKDTLEKRRRISRRERQWERSIDIISKEEQKQANPSIGQKKRKVPEEKNGSNNILKKMREGEETKKRKERKKNEKKHK